MKVFLFVVLCALYYAHADDMRSCITNENCYDGECCISMSFLRGFCHTLGKEGEHCIMKPAETEHGTKNCFGCPCQEGLVCKPQVEHEENGILIYKNLTCSSP